jgi:hypothetical protein
VVDKLAKRWHGSPGQQFGETPRGPVFQALEGTPSRTLVDEGRHRQLERIADDDPGVRRGEAIRRRACPSQRADAALTQEIAVPSARGASRWENDVEKPHAPDSRGPPRTGRLPAAYRPIEEPTLRTSRYWISP